MTIHAAPMLGDPALEHRAQRRGPLTIEAISTLGTRMSFVAVGWLLLVDNPGLVRLGVVLSVQTLAYILFCPIGARLGDRRSAARISVLADLASALAIGAVAFFYTGNVLVADVRFFTGDGVLPGLAPLLGVVAALGALRAIGDRSKNVRPASANDDDDAPPAREGLTRLLLIIGGTAAGAITVWLGATGVLWLSAMVFVVAAVLATVESAPAVRPRERAALPRQATAPMQEAAPPDERDEIEEPSPPADEVDLSGETEPSRRDPGLVVEGELVPPPPPAPIVERAGSSARMRYALAELWHDRLIRRLALVLFCTNLLAQVAATMLVVVWVRDGLRTSTTLGFVGGAFVLGAVGGAVVFSSLTANPARYFLHALGYLAGGGTLLVLDGLRPALLLIVVVAMVAGAATASITPAIGTLLSHRVPAALRSRVGGLAATAAYLGIPAGALGGAWILGHTDLLRSVAIAVGLLVVAMGFPLFGYRSWRQLGQDASTSLGTAGAQKLPARLTVTLAYANGQWLVEVRKGRALLGARHLVKSEEAMNMLTLLDVPGVNRSIEEALMTDQAEATRQAERMRNELAEMEAKLAGLTEMVDLTDHRKAS